MPTGKADPKAPVSSLTGVGPKLEASLVKFGLSRIQDLLFHLPTRYLDRTRITPFIEWDSGRYQVGQGQVVGQAVVFGRRRSLLVRVSDGSATLHLRFYHFSNAQKSNFIRNRIIRFFGEARPGQTGLELYHPEYEFVDEDTPVTDHRLTPIYPATEGITQPRLRKLCQSALASVGDSDLTLLIEPRAELGSDTSMLEILRYLHRPPANASIELLINRQHPFQQILALEELTAHQVCLLKARQQIKHQLACAMLPADDLRSRFLEHLGFEPTAAQHRVIKEIDSDLDQHQPMLRLLQGDVGSGKTLVAALSMLRALASDRQAILMAPTEILAEQHFDNFQRWLAPLDISPWYLSGKTKGKARQRVLQAFADSSAKIIIGTHALFQSDVHFSNLALVVIDEQHRFGVGQRLALAQKKGAQHEPRSASNTELAHQLVMTATPIPRTLAMSHYSDLDTSIIDELPPGRTPVVTSALDNRQRSTLIDRVAAACKAGKQAYWVCTLIEESESLQAQAAEVTASELATALPNIHVGLVHGRMKAAEKSRVMASFKSGEISLLVATTVIEVGVDVPNASLMVIENPERLGLSQLHQLRGRVGRGADQSYCVLLYSAPLSQAGRARINAMRETGDGFKIADIDLRLRGPGELLGSRQAGNIDFHLADLQRDADLLPDANEMAKQILDSSPELSTRLIDRWTPKSVAYLDA